jgi:hypothetical protein
MHRLSLAAALVAVASLPLASRPRVASGSVSDTRAIWSEVSKYIAQSAQDMSDSDFAFRPTPQVRTFGQIIAHIAGSQHLMCAAALGEAGGSEDDIEKTKTTKADIVAALKASNEYCARAYAQADDQVAYCCVTSRSAPFTTSLNSSGLRSGSSRSSSWKPTPFSSFRARSCSCSST